jgi:hypothetical protein
VIDKKDPDYLALPPEERKKLDIHTGFPLYNESNLEKINDIRRAKSRPDINIWKAPVMTKGEVMFTTWAQNGEKPATCYSCAFYNADKSCMLIGPNVRIKKFTMGVQEFWPCCGMQINGEPNKGAEKFISHCDPDTLDLIWINCRTGLEYGGATCGGKNGSDDCDYYYPYDTADKRESLSGHCQVMQNEVGCGDVCTAWQDDDQVEWREAQEWIKKGIPPPPREEKKA